MHLSPRMLTLKVVFWVLALAPAAAAKVQDYGPEEDRGPWTLTRFLDGYPEVVALAVVVLVALAWWVHERGGVAEDDLVMMRHGDPRLMEGVAATAEAMRKRHEVLQGLSQLRRDDPNFSEILFLDFAGMIHTRLEEARGGGDWEGLKPYLAAELEEQLAAGGGGAEGKTKIRGVLVGNLQIEEVSAGSRLWVISCAVESRHTEVTRANGKEREAHIHQELRLRFKRRKGVLSKEPEALRTLGCPSCGSPTKLDRENLCAHCGQAVEPGQFHWELFERQPRSLSTVEATRPRLGGWKGEIRFAYLYDAAIREAWRSFSMRNPGETLERLLRRARQIFCAVQDAWAGGDVAPLRGLLTDRLFQVHLFWHDWLEASRYRVELERVEVQESELVRLWRDAFYDIATVKLVGERVESVRDASGKMIFGSTSKAQPFCEYLTFVRRTRAGAKALRATRCPACGAPAPARMAEVCGFCGASLFAGEFDWTLAGIELGRLRK